MPFSFLKDFGWDWLNYTPLFLMSGEAPDMEKRKTIHRFAVQLSVALLVMLITTGGTFYVGMKIVTAEITVNMKNMATTLEKIEINQEKQADISRTKEIEFFTHKHDKKDGSVKLRGEQ